jgi:hypothetical protein
MFAATNAHPHGRIAHRLYHRHDNSASSAQQYLPQTDSCTATNDVQGLASSITSSVRPGIRDFAERILWKICRDCRINPL